ncbi:MAG: glutamate/tyrosine decarboxylase-like PLP-dependent enzyme [Candidatus Azotimanducaceae bacterium]|jgi:glutamate/tyrosine decarboxylase-like PLP-dependent enzyme
MGLMDKDLEKFDALTNSVAHWSAKFHAQLNQHQVANTSNPLPKLESLEQSGLGAEKAFDEFSIKIAPFLSGSAGPRYLGFVTGGVTPAAILGDWLTSAVDQNVMVPGDSISTAIELQVLAWLRELLAINDEFEGVLTSGATSANLLGILTARQFAGERQNLDIARNGLGGAQVEVFSACPHASMKKVISFSGLGRENITEVPCLPRCEEMDITALEKLLSESQCPGKIVIASAGTVTGTDFDDLVQISALCKKHDAWLHVDAAFGLFSRLVPELRDLTNGINSADSITCDAHKWLNVPYDSGIFYTRHAEMLNRTCSVSAPYLEVSNSLPALMDRGIENSRRFRALPIWMSLKAYGKNGYRDLVKKNCDQAAFLAEWIRESPGYELMTSCKLNILVFRPKNQEVNVTELLSSINQSGLVYLTPGLWFGAKGIRAAFSNWRTEQKDIEIICDVLKNALETNLKISTS